MVVGSLNVLINFLDQFLDAAKRPATSGLLRNPVEPDLHLIQPRGIGRCEVHAESWPCCEPAFYPRMFARFLLGNPDISDAGDAADIGLAICPSPYPVRQTASWSRGVGNRGSRLRRSPVQSATSAACVRAPESGFFHPHTKTPHFPADASTDLQYPVLSLQKIDRSRA